MPDITQKDVHELTESMKNVVGNDQQLEDMYEPLFRLLAMPDDQFTLMAPGVLESYKRSVNNPTDKIALAQALNATGKRVEELTDAFGPIQDEIDKMNLPVVKRDFLKEIMAILLNALADTEGVAKKYIQVAVELCHEDASIPQYAHISDSGADVFALEDITIHPGETVLVPTGIKLALPPGYEVQVRPKSGRALKTKLRIANTPGTIDAGYRDEIKVIIENVEPPIKDITVNEDGRVTSMLYGSDFYIHKGEKFCQLVLMEVPKMSLFRVDSVHELGEDRGGGFGSTGLKK